MCVEVIVCNTSVDFWDTVYYYLLTSRWRRVYTAISRLPRCVGEGVKAAWWRVAGKWWKKRASLACTSTPIWWPVAVIILLTRVWSCILISRFDTIKAALDSSALSGGRLRVKHLTASRHDCLRRMMAYARSDRSVGTRWFAISHQLTPSHPTLSHHNKWMNKWSYPP